MFFSSKTYVFYFFFSEKKFFMCVNTTVKQDFCRHQGIRGNFLKDNYSIIKYFVNLQINYTEQLKKNKKTIIILIGK